MHFTPEIGRAICARVASGESQVSICSDPAMPSRSTIFCWAKLRPKFAEELARAKAASGRKAKGKPSTYCAVTAGEIFERMCEGEGVVSICRDPAMPSFSTVYYWRRHFDDFREMMETARKIQAERFCDLGWEIAEQVTPETAFATRVKLAQLRWTASVLAPRDYGRFKPQEPAGEPPPRREMTLLIRHFEIETRADGATRVVGYSPNPKTGQRERDSESEWSRPPTPEELAAREPVATPPRRVHAPSPEDEQWL